jgi:7-cyano-7-deazaguanine synthase
MASLSEKNLIVLSGGLDSTTLAYQLVRDDRELAGIHFDIGYRPRVAERNSARLAAHRLGIPLEIVSLPGIFDMVTGFYPTEFVGMGELDKGQPFPGFVDGVEIKNYVVGIHVLLSTAIYYAQLAGISKIYTALLDEQFKHNPGLTAFANTFVQSVQHLNPNRPVEMLNPYRDTPKAKIIEIGAELGVPFEDTWSCTDGKPIHCGKCNGCKSRKQAFGQSGVADPTRYET